MAIVLKSLVYCALCSYLVIVLFPYAVAALYVVKDG